MIKPITFRSILILMFLFQCCWYTIHEAVAQNSISLESCYQEARLNHPLYTHLETADRIAAFEVQNAKKQFLPQFALSAQATYQSEVTEVPVEVPGFEIETLTRDQYQARLDVSQRLFDGGQTKNQVRMANARASLDRAQAESSLYQVRAEILDTYFAALRADAQLRQLSATLKTLEAQYSKVASAVENGVSLPSNRDLIGVEILSLKQTLKQLSARRSALIEQLAILTGRDIDPGARLETPGPAKSFDRSETEINRPEIHAFARGRSLIDARQELANSRSYPGISAFGQGGYGKPGLNFLENAFRPYYLFGVKMNWNLSAFYTKKSEAEINALDAIKLTAEESNFRRSVEVRSARYMAEIEALNDILQEDTEIIELREQISLRSTAQLENGTITSSDYIRDLNAEANARVAREIHLLEINQLKHQIQNLYGTNEIE